MIEIIKSEEFKKELLDRKEEKISVEDTVSEIIENVRKNGDKALIDYTRKFDGAALESLEVSQDEIDEAFAETDEKFIEILKKAAKRIEGFHKKQLRTSFVINEEKGVILGQKIIPIERAGLYVPGGTASYPSSVLMNAVPAKIAGCKEIVITTPPSPDGKIAPVILAAAKIAGVDKIFKCGGAQAIAALAYGTETIPKVDKIVGPGNAFVAEAKKQVYGKVSIDMIAGPSEILIIADETNDADILAADLLSQAEHDKMAAAILVTNSESLAKSVQNALEEQIPLLPRREIARASIDDNGKIILVKDLAEAVELSDTIAPEHLEICTDNPFDYLDKITHAGSVFLGKNCPEALGDYMAGPNHTLPTSGTARFSNPLSVDDFIKKTQFTYFTREALSALKDDVAYFAEKEGLHGHAKSALIRFEKGKEA